MQESIVSLFENITTFSDFERFQRKLGTMSRSEIDHNNIIFQETYGESMYDKFNKKKRGMMPHPIPIQESSDGTPDQIPTVLERILDLSYNNWCVLVSRAKQLELDSDQILIMIDTTTEPCKLIISYDLDTLRMLDQKKEQFNQLSKDDQMASDRCANALFGVYNNQLYLVIKEYVYQKINQDINRTVSAPTDKMMSDLIVQSDVFVSSMRGHMLEKEIEEADTVVLKYDLMKLQEQNKNHMEFQPTPQFSPYFSFAEMNQFGVFNGNDNLYSPTPDNKMIGEMSTKDWCEKYKNSYCLSENDTYIWVQKMKQLYTGYNRLLESGNEEAIANRKQSILELGWNPEINFSEEAARLTVYRNMKPGVRYINVSHLYEAYDGTVRSIIDDEMKPVFILLFKRIDRTEGYSNMAVSLDPYLSDLSAFCRSYFDSSIYNDFRTKLTLSDYENQCKEHPSDELQMSVMVAFVKDNQYNKIRDMIRYHFDHRDYDKYNVDKMLSPLLLASPNILPQQYVYTILQICNISTGIKDDITPTEVSEIKDAKVYCIYKGTPEQYNANQAIQAINDLISPTPAHIEAPLPLTVNAVTNIMGYQAPIKQVSEACVNAGMGDVASLLHSDSVLQERVKNVDVDDDGTIVIHTVEDVNTEFFKCHRTLVSLEKAKNYESMKDELCKLKYLDNYAVRHMKNKNGRRYKDYADAHARITNDFNKYLAMVTEHDPKFNFTQYYEQSRWYEDEIRITKNFINRMIEILKAIFF